MKSFTYYSVINPFFYCLTISSLIFSGIFLQYKINFKKFILKYLYYLFIIHRPIYNFFSIIWILLLFKIFFYILFLKLYPSNQ
jgi:hypothetical protein